jgi:hypothetical protein
MRVSTPPGAKRRFKELKELQKRTLLKLSLIGVDTSNYLVVHPGGFAFNLMHVGRDGKIPVALNDTDSDVVVSRAYFVFRVSDERGFDICLTLL